MRALILDKIASVTQNASLRRDVRINDKYACQEGDIIAVRLLTNKATYNALELTTGRMSTLKQGDIFAGALGHRNALQGYAGHIPTSIKTGDTINLLNMGGVLGTCTSHSPLVGPPHQCEVLGSILSFPTLGSRTGVPANISSNCLPLQTELTTKIPPIIAVFGTCMNSGKTEACLTIVQQLVRRGLTVAAAKTTGVSLRRDILAMEDAGATKTLIFTDLGIVTTQESNAPALTKTLINQLAKSNPDIIILEMGDGLLGEYGVAAILNDPEIAKSLTSVVLAASDPVGAWGAVELLNHRHNVTPTLITGPATDNTAGSDVIFRETNIQSLNARHNPVEIADLLTQSITKAHV
ncbi:MAG: hypothetical protein ACKVQS_05125 [Fimbriimonadaceae bacterium]